MSKIFTWLRDEKNSAALKMIGGAAFAVIAGLWAAYVHFFPAPQTNSGKEAGRIASDCGSVAVGGNVSGATIVAGNSGDCAKAPAHQAPTDRAR